VPHSEQRKHPLCHVLPTAFTCIFFQNARSRTHLRDLRVLTCSAKYTFLLQRGHCGVPPPHWRTGLPVGVERNSPMSAAPYRVPVVLAANGATLRAPIAPFPLSELARPRAAGLPVRAGESTVRFVGEGTRSSGVSTVPESGTVRGRPFSERPTCDGVNCESSLP
jgi:hypothetical protein